MVPVRAADRHRHHHSGGATYDVVFTPASTSVLAQVDKAYAAKYRGSAYLPAMLGLEPRAATLRVGPAPAS